MPEQLPRESESCDVACVCEVLCGMDSSFGEEDGQVLRGRLVEFGCLRAPEAKKNAKQAVLDAIGKRFKTGFEAQENWHIGDNKTFQTFLNAVWVHRAPE